MDPAQTSRVTRGMKRKRATEQVGAAAPAGSSPDGGSGRGFEVFLSFRGPDTRYTIADSLHKALNRVSIRTFKDDPDLRIGEQIGDSLFKAIDDCRIYIPIFSKDYASSKWCLRELTHMVERKERRLEDVDKKVILPIFYNVDADDVKLKSKLYQEALGMHKRESGEDIAKEWEMALKEVASIKGTNLKDHGQDKLVKLMVEKVTSVLWKTLTDVPDDFVGIKDRKDEIMKKLDLGVSDVRFIVIHGMGGIGKTTLAEAVYRQISPQFQDHCCFLHDVRSHDILTLQKKLLSDILKLSFANLSFTNEGTNYIKNKFKDKKVFIVLDDIDKLDQIKSLVGHTDWFGGGSGIIITTRNIDFLINASRENISFYEMSLMDPNDALQLFCERALGLAKPPPEYVDISSKLIIALGRLPLALHAVGSTLSGKSKSEWEEILQRLEKVMNKDVKEKLIISYEALDVRLQQIYLDIACFFINQEKTSAIKYWDAVFGSSTRIDVEFLTHMSLIKITSGDKLWMHDQLRDLGRDIVNPENIKSNQKGSRLWSPKKAFNVVQRKKGTKKIVALNLGTPEPDATYGFKHKEFMKLVNLRFLQLDRGNFEGDFEDCFSELRWLSWSNCPLEFRANNFGLENLVVLKLSGVNITQDWGGWCEIMVAKQLKVLTLEDCPFLKKTPTFYVVSGLERLILRRCTKLREIDNSIGDLQHLDHLEIQSRELSVLPRSIGNLTKVNHLILQCPMLQELPDSFGQLESLLKLDVRPSRIKELPHSIGNLEKLEVLCISKCELEGLPDSIGRLQSLVELDLSISHVTNLPDCIGNLKRLKVINLAETWTSKLPKAIGMLKNLEELDAHWCPLDGEIPSEIGELSSLKILKLSEGKFSRLPTTINQLTNLQELFLDDCHCIQELLELPKSLTKLSFSLTSVSPIPDLSNLTNLVELNMWGSPVQEPNIEWLVRLRSLRTLRLGGKILTLPPIDLSSLPQLQELHITCVDPQPLTRLPSSLQVLVLWNVQSSIDWSLFSNLENLSTLALLEYQLEEIRFDVLGKLRRSDTLRMEVCASLKKVPVLPCLKEIRSLWFAGNPQLTEIQGLGELKSLRELQFYECNSIRTLTEADLLNLPSLNSLRFRRCGSLQSLPSLPHMKASCHLLIEKCPRLRDYDGPYRSYRGGEIL